MKKMLISSGLIAAFILNVTALGAAQEPKRIQFVKGKSSAVVKGSTGQYGVSYVVRGRSGQKLVLDLASMGKVGIKVETEGSYGHQVLLREEGGGVYEVGLEESGDYTIFIGSIGGKPVSFTLAVAIRRLADI